ncbi:low molecular weight protein-tyrosine-phosphatase [Kroppenstedtia eburnea]|uniref:protein-tyrosine-phosphatase n=1 Tax=Kroppenstedtia eburnea TaxID=714067 RepID=A0A1N7M4K4_9BACL|nr:low molecular weight protein-tyrosine-phosphatase [Kroppenstedtia eburnea]QKI81826.1 low molecular weight phosphotyrosine protein phosphatase [Kroppenstedtia eburnea]SIS81024.1 protein-tyrosine phosphatase [Kroppenstedtia eburnea]
MVSVLFVCLGNICRSPMAEAVLRHQLREEGLEERVRVDSAGTGDWHAGEAPHRGTRTLLADRGISFAGIRARQIEKQDLEDFDYVIVMDHSNYLDVKNLAGREAELHRFVDFIPDTEYKEVPDPYFTGDFEETYRLVEAGCQGIIRTLREKEEL